MLDYLVFILELHGEGRLILTLLSFCIITSQHVQKDISYNIICLIAS